MIESIAVKSLVTEYCTINFPSRGIGIDQYARKSNLVHPLNCVSNGKRVFTTCFWFTSGYANDWVLEYFLLYFTVYVEVDCECIFK